MRIFGNCAACNNLFYLFTTLRHLGLGSADFADFALTPKLSSLYPTVELSLYSLPSFDCTTGTFGPVALIAGVTENPGFLLQQYYWRQGLGVG